MTTQSSSFLKKALNLDSLPSPPQVAVKVLEICRNPDAGLTELSDVLSLDSALSAKILRISNSASYSRGRQITSVAHAISSLGTRNVSIIALGFSLQTSLPCWKHTSGLSDTDLWRFNVATAVSSRALSRLVGFSDHDTAFMCGLMSRIGQLMMFTISPHDYGAVLDESNGKLPTPELEETHLGVNHHMIGRLLLEKWNLPNQICKVVENWHAVDKIDTENRNLAAIVNVANLTAELLFSEDKARGLQQLHCTAKDLLQVTGGEIDRLFLSCQEELRETLAAFDDPNAGAIDCDAVMESARLQLVQVSLNLVSDLSRANLQTTSLQAANRDLQRTSRLDALTGLMNRAALDEELDDLAQTRLDRTRPYSIVMVDIDDFKGINDCYGHLAGDQVLKSVGHTLLQQARATDLVARYGGEEFTMILTNAGKKNSFNAAERYRKAIERLKIELPNKTVSVTVSLGVASSDHFVSEKSVLELIELADAALYEAKRRGRNQAVECDQIVSTLTRSK